VISKTLTDITAQNAKDNETIKVLNEKLAQNKESEKLIKMLDKLKE
jgi:hypothetical protein